VLCWSVNEDSTIKITPLVSISVVPDSAYHVDIVRFTPYKCLYYNDVDGDDDYYYYYVIVLFEAK